MEVASGGELLSLKKWKWNALSGENLSIRHPSSASDRCQALSACIFWPELLSEHTFDLQA
jgi:hypothetical protein